MINSKRKVNTFLLSIVILLTLGVASGFTNLNYEFVDSQGSNIGLLNFDYFNGTLGSNSFMDYIVRNPNLYLSICYEGISESDFFDLVYFSESLNLSTSLLNFKHRVPFVENNCTLIDFAIASKNAVFPGVVGLSIDSNSSSNDTIIDTDLLLNGSFEIGIFVDGPTRTYNIRVINASDPLNNSIINFNAPMVMSLVNGSSDSLNESLVRLNEPMTYSGRFRGGESIYVNSLQSLEIKIMDACDPINESGYYIINSTKWNINESCLTVDNITDVIINFADNLIDGDGLDNGSKNNVTKPCAVTVRNSQNITFEGFKSQEFYHGICVRNSSVTILQDNSVENVIGALVYDNSNLFLFNKSFNNELEDIIILNNSRVRIDQTRFFNATKLKADFKDVNVSSVRQRPQSKPDPELENIDQFIQINSNSNDSWSQINFIYDEELPNRVVTDNISIFKFTGTYVENLFDNNTNTTFTGYLNETWTQIFTVVSPSERLIQSPNMTSFSIYAPFGEPKEVTDPEPVPEPTPRPSPESGPSPGAGGSPSAPVETEAAVIAEALLLNLTLPENVTVQQGQSIDVNFNVSNLGDVSSPELTLVARVLPGWEATNGSVPPLSLNENYSGNFQLATFERTTPDTYFVRVELGITTTDGFIPVITDILEVIVRPRSGISRIRVLEYPALLSLEPATRNEVSFLVENIGDVELNDIRIDFDSDLDCLINIQGSDNVLVGQQKAITYTFVSSNVRGECRYNLRFIENDTLVGFAPMLVVVENQGLFTSPRFLRQLLLIIVFILWSLYTYRIIYRRRGLITKK